MPERKADRVEKTAVIAGSTGLVGRECLSLLLEQAAYRRVVALVRKATGIRHGKYEELVTAFDDLGSIPMVDADDAFCALGTTIRKAGSKDAFYRVDHDFVVSFAYWARGGGAESFNVVSSVGANPSSGNFYLSTKGDMELAVKEQRFPRVNVFRPSVIVGEREEARPTEKWATGFLRIIEPVLAGPLRQYRAIPAKTIAAAMVAAAQEEHTGLRTYVYDQIIEAAGAG